MISNHRRSARGLTLLELLLALSLSVIILAAVGMAIELQLRTLESRRTYLEEAQIARAVLRMIAADLRSAVSHEPQDFSAIESMLASIGGEALDTLAAEAGDGTGQGGTGQGGTGQGGTGQGGTGQGGTGQGGTGQGGTGQGGTGQGGTGQGGTGSGTGQGGSGGSGGSGSGQGNSSGEDPLLDEPSTATTDLASNVQPPPKPGLYGNSFELQVDVSRLPRLDELRYQNSSPTASGVMMSQIPSDVRTVTWYVQGGTMTAPMGAGATTGATAGVPTGATTGAMAGGAGLAAPVVGDFGEISSGLVRREMGRAVTQWAISSGQTQQLQGLGELLAPEVTGLQFLYFDGYQWYSAWDSDQMGGLPLAVEITLFMQPRDSLLDDQGQVVLDPALTAQTSGGVVEGQLVYRLVVRLPNARPAPPQQGDELESLGL